MYKLNEFLLRKLEISNQNCLKAHIREITILMDPKVIERIVVYYSKVSYHLRSDFIVQYLVAQRILFADNSSLSLEN